MDKENHCPSCRQRLLDTIKAQGSLADICLRCGGLWFEAGNLSSAIRDHDPSAMSPEPVANSVRSKLGVSDDRCPNCRIPLSVYSLSEANPLPVEICQTCSGVWLPHGSLDRALAGHQLLNAEQIIQTDRTWANWFLQFLTGLPIEFNIVPRRTPGVTYGLVFICGLVHLASPFIYLLFGVSVDLLALDPELIGQPTWFASLLTSQFMHVNTIHLLGNMYFLWILGDNVEDVLGRRAFLIFYLSAGIAGGVFYSFFVDPSNPAVGASGAISGVLAVYAVLFRRSKLTFMLLFWQFKLRAPFYVGIWVAFNVAGWAFGAAGVAWEAHIGGFIFGMAVGAAAYSRLLSRRPLLRLLNDGAAPAA